MAFIALDRGIVDHWIYQDAEYFKVWFEMLYRARYSLEPSRELQGDEIITVNYGEFIYGRKGWSERLGVSEQRLRTLIKKLRADEMIEVVSEHRKCTLYRITNYAKFNQQSNHQPAQVYQGFSDSANQQSNQQLTTSQPAANQQLTTKEQSNKETKKQSNKKIKYAETVSLTESEYQKLVNGHGEQATKQMIEILDNYKGASGKKYVSDYKAILNWVVKRYYEEENKRPFQQNRPLSRQEKNQLILQKHMNEVSDYEQEAGDAATYSLFDSLPTSDDH